MLSYTLLAFIFVNLLHTFTNPDETTDLLFKIDSKMKLGYTLEYSQVVQNGNDASLLIKWRFIYSKDGMLVHTVFPADSSFAKARKASEIIYCINSKYAFKVVKDINSGLYKSINIDACTLSVIDNYDNFIMTESMGIATARYFISGKPFTFWNTMPGFSVTRGNPAGKSGSYEIQSDYDSDEKNTTTFSRPSFHAKQVHDTSKDNSIISSDYAINIKRDGKVVRSRFLNYFLSYNGSSLESVKLVIGANGKIESTQIFHIDNESFESVDSSKLTLTAFGLPEPSWINGENSKLHVSWFFYSSVTGVLCLLIAAVILYRRNKKAA